MRRIGTLENEAGLFDLAGSSDPASLRPAACEPVSIGDLVAVIVSDAGATAAERRHLRAGSRREFLRISRA